MGFLGVADISTTSENHENEDCWIFGKWKLKVTSPMWSRIILRRIWATLFLEFRVKMDWQNPFCDQREKCRRHCSELRCLSILTTHANTKAQRPPADTVSSDACSKGGKAAAAYPEEPSRWPNANGHPCQHAAAQSNSGPTAREGQRPRTHRPQPPC